VTFAAGLACEGFRPVVAIYSSFLQRAFDQIVHDVCLQNLPVIFCMDRAGLVGEDGATHHGAFDPAFLRIIPNMAVMAPRDEDELRHMLATAVQCNVPVAIRYPRGSGVGVPLEGKPTPLPWGRAEVMQQSGSDLLLIAVGPMAHLAMEAAAQLSRTGTGCTVINARFIKPLDEETLVPAISRAKAVITLEDSSVAGGFGSAVLELCEARGLQPRCRRLGIPDRWIPQGTIAAQQGWCGLTVQGVVAAYQELTSSERLQAVS